MGRKKERDDFELSDDDLKIVVGGSGVAHQGSASDGRGHLQSFTHCLDAKSVFVNGSSETLLILVVLKIVAMISLFLPSTTNTPLPDAT